MNLPTITIKHFLNTSLESKNHNLNEFYPLYIQVTAGQKSITIKSSVSEHLDIYRSDIVRISQNDPLLFEMILSGFFSEILFEKILLEQLFPVFHLLEDEKNVIKTIVEEKVKENPQDFDLTDLNDEYKKNLLEITEILDSHIKTRYREELNNLFLKSIDKAEKEKNIFRISNYFIHFINWENTFYNFYEATYEINPSKLKAIENHLPPDLLTEIKAYLAYYSQINLVTRFLNKREQGRISTISYLDWKNTIYDILCNQFRKLLGGKKTSEYMSVLDTILKKKIQNNIVNS
ncbi:MAG: hypothetical protein JXJ22_18500 [Bacteroidales bacterium]|nr:hypothetical protein [Bacteroidales bacterium]